MSMRHIVVCGLPRSTTFLALSHKRHDIRKEAIENKMHVPSFPTIIV
jgi:hypothetical protein